MAPASRPPAVRATGIRKVYGALVANDDVDLTVPAGSVHAVLGENGAGKSTLMKVLFGMVRADAGTVEVHGQPVALRSSADALAAGIGMVQQHFSLVDDFTVAENLAMTDAVPGWRRWTRRVDLAATADRARDLGGRFGLRVDPGARVRDLSVGARQRVEILKALWRGASVLILDEPTAALAPPEVADLFRVLGDLRAAGTTIVVITHKMTEVIDHCDGVTVLRDGAVVGTAQIADELRADAAGRRALEDRLVQLMIGRPRPPAPLRSVRVGEPVLRVDGLTDGGRFGPVDLVVRAGEIVGVAGVEGNGQGPLVELLLGLRRPAGGRIVLDGVDLTSASTRTRLAGGLAHIAEDRHATAVAETLSVTDNACLGFTDAAPLRRSPLWLSRRRGERLAAALVARHQVRSPGTHAPLTSLSGGNQQKLVVGRELARAPRLMIAAQPTRGLDVGATHAVHSELAGLRDAGAGVLLISLDLGEVLGLADRVVVLSGGRVVGETTAAEADLDTLGRWMTVAPTAGEERVP
jgi:simple sugar transport system ATP-binding protein